MGLVHRRSPPPRRLSFAARTSPPAASTSPPATSGGAALVQQQQQQQQTALRVARQRTEERRRFGVPIYQLLGVGALGVGLVARHWLRSYESVHGEVDERLAASGVTLDPHEAVTTSQQAVALMWHVRQVLDRHGLSLGDNYLRVRVRTPAGIFSLAEGLTRKGLRPPPALRGVDEITLRPGLSALHAAQVLAHEYMHAWLWLQGFPHLEPWLEEGLCELASYLYLLSCLHEPVDGASPLRPDERHLRAQIHSIEANAHPDYGGGFRACAAALRHVQLHQLLAYVREHGELPPPP